MTDMQNENATLTPDSGGSPAVPGSPPGIGVREAIELLRAVSNLFQAGKTADNLAWQLIEAITKDERVFPKAVLIGRVHTDVATLKISGVTSKALKICTGADGGYDVYADNYSAHGFPGRIIIEVGHPVTTEAVNAERTNEGPTL
jgi:hypothetical protein